MATPKARHSLTATTPTFAKKSLVSRATPRGRQSPRSETIAAYSHTETTAVPKTDDFQLNTAKRRVAFSNAQRRRRLSHAYEPQASPQLAKHASPKLGRRGFGQTLAKKARLQASSQQGTSKAFELFAFDASSP
jgi:hypothetical protein